MFIAMNMNILVKNRKKVTESRCRFQEKGYNSASSFF